MRLTSDIVLEADQGLNCIGDRELVLRNRAIPEIENLAIARDGFDTIDLSANMISVLGDGFPRFDRLRSLYLGGNRITRIVAGIADALPNLRVLVLTSNRLKTIEDLNLHELSRFAHLEVLSIADNPVSDKPGVRQNIIDKLPALKVLNFRKVSQQERRAASNAYSQKLLGKRKRTQSATDAKRVRAEAGNGNIRTSSDAQRENSKGFSEQKREGEKKVTLTKDQSEALRRYVEQAQSVEEVTRMQEAVRNGTVADFLQTIAATAKTHSVKPLS